MMKEFLARAKREIRIASDYHAGDRGRFLWFCRTFPVGSQLPPGAKLLDAGCGGGGYVFYLARRRPDWWIRGIDIDEAAITTCKKVKKDYGYYNVDFCVCDLASDSDLGEDEYDAIYCVDVLHYILDDQLALENITRALKPGSIFWVHVPLLQRKSYFKRSIRLDTVPNIVRDGYDTSEFLQLLGDSGLEVLSTYITFGKYGGLGWELWKISASSGIARLVLKPLIIVLLRLDPHFRNREGRGILVLARKPVVYLHH